MIGRSAILIAGSLLVAAAPVQASQIREVVSKKGIIAWFVQDNSVPLIALTFMFRGAGSATAPASSSVFSRPCARRSPAAAARAAAPSGPSG